MAVFVGEGGGEPELDGGFGFFGGEEAGAEGEDVGVVVLFREGEDVGVAAVEEGSADAGDFVGGDGFALAGTADDEAEAGGVGCDFLAAGDDEVGIVVQRVVGERADVFAGVAVFFEEGDEGEFEFEAGVVGGEVDHGGELF